MSQLGPLQLPPEADKRLKTINRRLEFQKTLPNIFINVAEMTRKKVEIYLEYSEEVGVV
jgi:hypothetical protein